MKKAVNLKKMSNDELSEYRRKLKSRIKEVKSELRGVEEECIIRKISPFKSGQDVMYEVSVGRSKKVTRCKLVVETVNHVTGARVYPYKKDGTLSNRGFYVYEFDELKECE